MEIKFYEIKKVDLSEGLMKGVVESKGASKGCVKVKGGKLYIKIKDKKLKDILSQPCQIRKIKRDKKGSFKIETQVYNPGEIEHLKIIASRCWEFGYIATIRK